MLNTLKPQVPEKLEFKLSCTNSAELQLGWLKDLKDEVYNPISEEAYNRVIKYFQNVCSKTAKYISEHYGKLAATERGLSLLSFEFNRIAFGDEDTWSVVLDLVNNKRNVNGDAL